MQGFYKVQYTNAEFYPFKDGKKPFIQLTLTISESAHDAGEVNNTLRDRVNVPHESQTTSAKEWTEKFLKTTMIGLGHDAAQVSGLSGALTLGPTVFVGREGVMHYEPYDPNDKSTRSNVTWVTPEQYGRGVQGTFKVPLKNKPATIDTPAAAALPPAGFTTATTTPDVAFSNGPAAPAAAGANLAALLG